MIENKENSFVTYVRTKQFWQYRFRYYDVKSPVHIPMAEIKERFFSSPHNEIKKLVDAGFIEVSQKETQKGNKANYYKVLQAGGINPSMLKPKGKDPDTLARYMRDILKLVSLKENSTSTIYFDTFLILKETNIDLFFTIDEFSGRIHTPVSSFQREYRPNILINGQSVSSLDVVTMQPLLLGKILKSEIGENDYSNWINSGEDIYLIIQDKAKLNTRDEAKKRFFEILFSKPNKQLSALFGNSCWIEWINAFKGRLFEPNPHTLEKNHSNLAWLLQKTEVVIMREVWQALKDNNILFLSVHDEILIRDNDLIKAEKLFDNVLSKEFEYYKLSSKVVKDLNLVKEGPQQKPLINQILIKPTAPATYSLEQLEAMATRHLNKTMLKDKQASKANYMRCWSEGMEPVIIAAGFTRQHFLNSMR